MDYEKTGNFLFSSMQLILHGDLSFMILHLLRNQWCWLNSYSSQNTPRSSSYSDPPLILVFTECLQHWCHFPFHQYDPMHCCPWKWWILEAAYKSSQNFRYTWKKHHCADCVRISAFCNYSGNVRSKGHYQRQNPYFYSWRVKMQE